jgi:hypothetical protein
MLSVDCLGPADPRLRAERPGMQSWNNRNETRSVLLFLWPNTGVRGAYSGLSPTPDILLHHDETFYD